MAYANPVNITDFGGILSYLGNDATNGMLGIVLVLITFCAFFIMYKDNFNLARTLQGSLWVSMIVSILLNLMDMLAPEITVIVLALAFGSLLLKGR